MDGEPYSGSHMAVLRVRLDLVPTVPEVVTELVGYPHGEEHTYGYPVRLPVTDYGLSAESGPPTGAVVPAKLLDAVVPFMTEHPGHSSGLWLRLVPPYGHLGAIPWEREIVPRIWQPMIRVPDLLPVAADLGRVWSVAIVVHELPHREERGILWAPWYVASFIKMLHRAIGSGVAAHVFADGVTYEGLRRLLPEYGPAHLYPVADSETAGQDHPVSEAAWAESPAGLPSPFLWADWIASSLRGEAVRALYVLAPATFDGDRPVLTMGPDPQQPTDPDDSVYVTAEDLRQLANRLGASTLCLGSPEDNPCDAATRLLADALGQHRAGPTFYSDLRVDPDGAALAGAHAFLNDPARLDPIPRDPSLFGHLQPRHVQALLDEPWPDPDGPDQSWLTGRTSMGDSATSQELVPAFDAVPDTERISDQYAGGAAVPTWVAATERYLETKAAKLLEAASIPGETPPMKQAFDRGMAWALSDLRRLTQVQDYEDLRAHTLGVEDDYEDPHSDTLWVEDDDYEDPRAHTLGVEEDYAQPEEDYLRSEEE
ncbi:hypothetical protein ACFVJ8_23660 [Streptomyces yangpuensis]|uniref:hypothetical protein n=1 Tax=Streptomyces yangpuensis TaxID=1648182 RepID=UPI0036410D4A